MYKLFSRKEDYRLCILDVSGAVIQEKRCVASAVKKHLRVSLFSSVLALHVPTTRILNIKIYVSCAVIKERIAYYSI